MDDYRTRLLSYVPRDRIVTLSCGHVIPEANLVAWPVARGPTGQELEFTFAKRGSPKMVTAFLSRSQDIPAHIRSG